MIRTEISLKDVAHWSVVLEGVPSTIFKFARKALQRILPTASNLVIWVEISNSECQLCQQGNPQTNKHVLSICSSRVALERYTSRHDDILHIIVNWLKSCLGPEQELFADVRIDNIRSTQNLFVSSRPDIVICGRASAAVLELTICHESN